MITPTTTFELPKIDELILMRTKQVVNECINNVEHVNDWRT